MNLLPISASSNSVHGKKSLQKGRSFTEIRALRTTYPFLLVVSIYGRLLFLTFYYYTLDFIHLQCRRKNSRWKLKPLFPL